MPFASALIATGGAPVGGRIRTATPPPEPGSVGAIALRCRPHCWQYANPTGVGVAQRGHVIVLPAGVGRGDTTDGEAIGPPGAGAISGPGAGDIIGAPTAGPNGFIAGVVGCIASVAPQLRQNFMLPGFSPRHCAQMTVGNPDAGGGVAVGGGASAVPQFKQNDEPGGLWWPQAEQRIN